MDNLIRFSPADHLMKSAPTAQGPRYVIGKAVLEKSKNIKQGCFTGAVCADNNAERRDVRQFNIFKCLEVFQSDRLNLHCVERILKRTERGLAW